MAKKEFINEGGINGTGTGVVNVNSESFKATRKMIEEISTAQSDERKIKTNIRSLRFQMEDYLNEENPSEIKTTGWFLNELIQSIQIKNKDFADYIGIQSSNLSALIKGTRRINIDLAFKLDSIFNINPALWLHIQNKNDLLQIKKGKRSASEGYSLEELLERRA